MKRVHALISGEVQGVGYREEVKCIAFELNIYGWVRNLEDGRVEITAEGEDRSIEEFLEKININKYPIFVEEVESGEEIYKGDLKSFKVIRHKDVQKEILSALSRGTVEKQDLHIKTTETGFADVKEGIHKGFGEVRATLARMQAG
jgi:acylphosphatase